MSYEIDWPYLIEWSDGCTCAAGPHGYYGMHETFCGGEPIGRIDGDNPIALGSMMWDMS